MKSHTSYNAAYAAWREHPTGYWAEAARGLDWDRDFSTPLTQHGENDWRWFADGELNVCGNAVDRHVDNGRGEQTALVYDSPLAGRKCSFTYRQLRDEVARTAGMLRQLGVALGDRVVIYMPMVPEAVFAMLACARIGAVHSVVFGGFADHELAKRIDHAGPVLVLSASHGIEPGRTVPYKPLLDSALDRCTHQPRHCVILQREGYEASLDAPRDLDWEATLALAEPVGCVPVKAGHPLYILYTSGTTGMPKGVVRDSGGYAVALHWSMQHIYGVSAGDCFWAASDIGWVVGHSYIVYGPLLAGCATILFEGKPVGTPDSGAYWRVVQEYGVKVLFAAPTALRAIKREDPRGRQVGRYDIAGLDALFLAGERADTDSILWAERCLDRPVIDHWWQTETGWSIAGNYRGLGLQATRYGSAGLPSPGYHLDVLDAEHRVCAAGETGDLAVRLPLPPGCLIGLWRDPDRFQRSYLTAHPGYYTSGDAGYIDEDGYVFVMSRTDDILNVAGHRLSTGALEEAICNVDAVVECAVIGVKDSLKGMVPIALTVLYPSYDGAEEELESNVVRQVREHVGAVAALKTVIVVQRLPKTRSGKVLRATLRRIADGEDYTVPPTIDDSTTLEEITARLVERGFPRTDTEDRSQ